MLRHPVVITSLEEDFKKIGLLKDKKPLEEGDRETTMGTKDLPKGQGGETGTGSPGSNTHREGSPSDLKMGYQTGGDELTGKQRSPKSKGIDHGQAEDVDEGDWDPLDEAIAFSEAFEEEWESMGEMREFSIDSADMKDLDGIAEESTELPGGFFSEDDSDDESDDSDDEQDGTMESIAASMKRIDDIVESMQTENSSESAIPAFANVALISEKLALFFDSIAEGDEDFEEAASQFAEMAKEAAGIVEVLRTEDDDEIDFDLVRQTFQERMGALMDGLEVYSELTEGSDGNDDGEDDEDDDEGND